jgi:hypothetical protein
MMNMQGGIDVQLADGTSIALSAEEIDVLYDRLWLQARRGSITAAAKLFQARRYRVVSGVALLGEQESIAFRVAYEKIAAIPPPSKTCGIGHKPQLTVEAGLPRQIDSRN